MLMVQLKHMVEMEVIMVEMLEMLEKVVQVQEEESSFKERVSIQMMD